MRSVERQEPFHDNRIDAMAGSSTSTSTFFVTAAAAGKRKRADVVGIEQLKKELHALVAEDAAVPLGVRCEPRPKTMLWVVD
jgi:hypothetical protein